MSQFYYEKYVNNYEIDYYDLTYDEKKVLMNKLKLREYELGCYYKSGNDWTLRTSGMSFNITQMNYYPRLKEHLDNEFRIFMRKQKLEKIENYEKDR